MKRGLHGTMVAAAFIATQVLAGAGCNALLGNGYGVDDGTNGGLGPDGGPGEDDALVNGGEGGPGGEGGGPGDDAMTTVDGSTLDANVDAAGCPTGFCPTVLTAAVGPQRIAVGATAIYWSTATGIGRMNIDGSGVPTTMTVGAPIKPTLKRGVALSPAGIPYVTVTDRGAAVCDANLMACGSNGVFVGSAGDASSIAADSTKVYVGVFDDGSTHGGIWQTTLSGTAPQPYTSALYNVEDLRVVATTTYFMAGAGVYFAPSRTSTSVSAANLGGELATVFDVSGQDLVVATQAGSIRVCTSSPQLMCPTITIQTRSKTITAIALDGAQMIWAEVDMNGLGSIYRSTLNAGAAVDRLADTQGAAIAIAVDAKNIYWAIAGAGGAIIKLEK